MQIRLKNRQYRDWAIKFVLHVVTGGASVAAHYGVMAGFLYFEFQPVVASSFGFVVGALTRFFTAYFHVYEPSANIRSTVPKFLVALGTQFVLNPIILLGLINTGIGVWWSQLVTTALLTFGNYLMYRLWVFQ